MSFIKEFREFAMRGNVVDLAVGVIIGAAFGKIVSSLVCSAAKFFAPKRIKLCTAANERKTAIAHGAN